MNITYEWVPSSFILGSEYYEKLVDECASLFSTQYGKWSPASPNDNAGLQIKISPKRIYNWLSNENVSLYCAKDDGKLIGYAISLGLRVPKYGNISWVTQLVVHADYRHKDIAKNILHSIWGFTDHFAWGIISASPYAIRALEKTTRRRCDPSRIKRNLKKIVSIGIDQVCYMDKGIKTFVTNETSRINTCFFVDHSDVEDMISKVTTDEVLWRLGGLEEGWEWLAFTFQDQHPFELTKEEVRSILDASDRVAQNAYKRMDMSAGSHHWAKHTDKEIDFIVEECALQSGDTVFDFGCGQGRHSLELAKRNLDVVGIDYVDKNIEYANKSKAEQNVNNATFVIDDCRTVKLSRLADAIICLYDVIGTYAENNENERILCNIARHLKPGGTALISVMNYQTTLSNAIYTFSLKDNPGALLKLKPSNLQETTGDVFNPEYYLVDTDEHIVYRKEQFTHGTMMPIELIVRDRRFLVDEIKEMCTTAGLQVVFTKFVNAKDWHNSLAPDCKSAKEIIVKCIKC